MPLTASFEVSQGASGRERFSLRARQVLIMRYMHDMTLEQVGTALGITRERVRQIESKALRMLRSRAEIRQKIADVLHELDRTR